MGTFFIAFLAFVILAGSWALLRGSKRGDVYSLDNSKDLDERTHTQEEDKAGRSFRIICERPKNWSFEKYKKHLKAQKEYIKKRRRGFLVYKAVEITTQTTKAGKTIVNRQTFRPFVGNSHRLKTI